MAQAPEDDDIVQSEVYPNVRRRRVQLLLGPAAGREEDEGVVAMVGDEEPVRLPAGPFPVALPMPPPAVPEAKIRPFTPPPGVLPLGTNYEDDSGSATSADDDIVIGTRKRTRSPPPRNLPPIGRADGNQIPFSKRYRVEYQPAGNPNDEVPSSSPAGVVDMAEDPPTAPAGPTPEEAQQLIAQRAVELKELQQQLITTQQGAAEAHQRAQEMQARAARHVELNRKAKLKIEKLAQQIAQLKAERDAARAEAEEAKRALEEAMKAHEATKKQLEECLKHRHELELQLNSARQRELQARQRQTQLEAELATEQGRLQEATKDSQANRDRIANLEHELVTLSAYPAQVQKLEQQLQQTGRVQRELATRRRQQEQYDKKLIESGQELLRARQEIERLEQEANEAKQATVRLEEQVQRQQPALTDARDAETKLQEVTALLEQKQLRLERLDAELKQHRQQGQELRDVKQRLEATQKELTAAKAAADKAQALRFQVQNLQREVKTKQNDLARAHEAANFATQQVGNMQRAVNRLNEQLTRLRGNPLSNVDADSIERSITGITLDHKDGRFNGPRDLSEQLRNYYGRVLNRVNEILTADRVWLLKGINQGMLDKMYNELKERLLVSRVNYPQPLVLMDEKVPYDDPNSAWSSVNILEDIVARAINMDREIAGAAIAGITAQLNGEKQRALGLEAELTECRARLAAMEQRGGLPPPPAPARMRLEGPWDARAVADEDDTDTEEEEELQRLRDRVIELDRDLLDSSFTVARLNNALEEARANLRHVAGVNAQLQQRLQQIQGAGRNQRPLLAWGGPQPQGANPAEGRQLGQALPVVRPTNVEERQEPVMPPGQPPPQQQLPPPVQPADQKQMRRAIPRGSPTNVQEPAEPMGPLPVYGPPRVDMELPADRKVAVYGPATLGPRALLRPLPVTRWQLPAGAINVNPYAPQPGAPDSPANPFQPPPQPPSAADEFPPSPLAKKFLDAQDGKVPGLPSYAEAMKEIEDGKRVTDWSWYIFPTWKFPNRSRHRQFDLQDFDEAWEYLQDVTLYPRLAEAIRKTEEKVGDYDQLERLLGEREAKKFIRCCTFFAITVARKDINPNPFTLPLVKLFGSHLDWKVAAKAASLLTPPVNSDELKTVADLAYIGRNRPPRPQPDEMDVETGSQAADGGGQPDDPDQPSSDSDNNEEEDEEDEGNSAPPSPVPSNGGPPPPPLFPGSQNGAHGIHGLDQKDWDALLLCDRSLYNKINKLLDEYDKNLAKMSTSVDQARKRYENLEKKMKEQKGKEREEKTAAKQKAAYDKKLEAEQKKLEAEKKKYEALKQQLEKNTTLTKLRQDLRVQKAFHKASQAELKRWKQEFDKLHKLALKYEKAAHTLHSAYTFARHRIAQHAPRMVDKLLKPLPKNILPDSAIPNLAEIKDRLKMVGDTHRREAERLKAQLELKEPLEAALNEAKEAKRAVEQKLKDTLGDGKGSDVNLSGLNTSFDALQRLVDGVGPMDLNTLDPEATNLWKDQHDVCQEELKNAHVEIERLKSRLLNLKTVAAMDIPDEDGNSVETKDKLMDHLREIRDALMDDDADTRNAYPGWHWMLTRPGRIDNVPLLTTGPYVLAADRRSRLSSELSDPVMGETSKQIQTGLLREFPCLPALLRARQVLSDTLYTHRGEVTVPVYLPGVANDSAYVDAITTHLRACVEVHSSTGRPWLRHLARRVQLVNVKNLWRVHGSSAFPWTRNSVLLLPFRPTAGDQYSVNKQHSFGNQMQNFIEDFRKYNGRLFKGKVNLVLVYVQAKSEAQTPAPTEAMEAYVASARQKLQAANVHDWVKVVQRTDIWVWSSAPAKLGYLKGDNKFIGEEWRQNVERSVCMLICAICTLFAIVSDHRSEAWWLDWTPGQHWAQLERELKLVVDSLEVFGRDSGAAVEMAQLGANEVES